eukprot:CAMPEP_0116872464 /NCGR_PEP_ID=MMETSP0463-20121206/3221_1 /TAXON_ID=181622 /ORGANISM="Strombidinopsis sp, Strain SopsisLIS2011" /LENGTH=63 /DNA_ID=CAMNT_0004512725 /DNA_START=1672 /DNA_END=1863 /DNA_ORIENTATION=+
MAIRDSRKSSIAGGLVSNTAITDKEFGAGDEGGKTSMTWENRARDWYNAERRMIFAFHNPIIK